VSPPIVAFKTNVSTPLEAAVTSENGDCKAHVANIRPSYVLTITIITILYLVLEFGFNAKLLDVTANSSSPSGIASIASWGRVISGIALTLALWSSALLPLAEARRWKQRTTIAMLAIAGGICMYGAYAVEQAVVRRLVDSSDGASRRAAVQLHALSAAVMSGSAEISGMDLSPARLSQTEGKAFLAIFPFIAISSDAITMKPEDIMRQLARSLLEQRYGTASQVYNDVFIPSVRSLRDAYNRYVAAQRRFSLAVQSIPSHEIAAWQATSQVARANPNSAEHHRVVDAARSAGAPVTDEWEIGDQRGFAISYASAARQQAEKEYKADVSAIVGQPMPPGLEWNAFAASPQVQVPWRATIGATPDITLSASMGYQAFHDQVYEPTLHSRIDTEIAPLIGPDSDYADGGPRETSGRAAMEWLVVPPMALVLSLIGALIHLYKVANFALWMIAPTMPKRRGIILAATCITALSAFLAPNQISSSDTFAYFEAKTMQKFGAVTALSSRWIVQAQPYFYPIGEAIRRMALLGFDFGYQPDALLSGDTRLTDVRQVPTKPAAANAAIGESESRSQSSL
jgi:hypothetical protein